MGPAFAVELGFDLDLDFFRFAMDASNRAHSVGVAKSLDEWL